MSDWKVGETYSNDQWPTGVTEIEDNSGYVVAYVPLHQGSARNEERASWPAIVASAKEIEDRVLELTRKVEELERELEDLRCPLSADSHRLEKMKQHHCPQWGANREQAALIRELGDKVAELEIKITARESLLDRLNAANERLNKSWDILKASSDEMSELISQQAAAIERLTKYVSHDCGKQEDPLEPCTCGLDAVLSRQELAK